MAFSPTPPDKDPNHIKRVYEAYGLAMYQAQCLEKQLAMVYATHSKPPRRITKEELEQKLTRNFEQTFGRLFGDMRRTVYLTSDFESRMQSAVDKRNWLAHDYFWDRAGHFPTDPGRETMIRELTELAEQFDTMDQQLDTVYRKWLERNGITKEHAQRALDEMIERARHS